MAEIWRAVINHEGYEVSNLGQVRSLDRSWPQRTRHGTWCTFHKKGRVLSPGTQKSGHVTVALGRGNSRLVHQLVCEAFHGSRPEGLEVRHLDGDCVNNAATNVAWGTRSQNIRDRKWHGNPVILSVDAVRSIRELLSEGDLSGREIAARFGVHEATISAVKHRRLHKDV
jgi:hypothetical protein